MQLPRFLCAGCGRTETGLSWSVPCVALIVNKLIVREGLDPRPFAGHSLRAGIPHRSGRARREHFQNDGCIAAQERGYSARIRAPGRRLQGSRGGGVPVMTRHVADPSRYWPRVRFLTGYGLVRD